MGIRRDIDARVRRARRDARKADDLVRDYLPFIKAETAKFMHRPPQEGRDDELSIAMFAFHEAVMTHDGSRGAFIPHATRVIRNRLVDFTRREARHAHTVSLDQTDGNDDERTIGDQIGAHDAAVENHGTYEATRQEIASYAKALAAYDVSFSDVAESCPKQERTLATCRKALSCAREHPEILERLEQTKKLPIAALVKHGGVERKTLERHRRYLIALLVAYTNGFEIIRGHLRALSAQPERGEP